MNVGIGTEAMQFLFCEYINWIFGTMYSMLQNDPQLTFVPVGESGGVDAAC